MWFEGDFESEVSKFGSWNWEPEVEQVARFPEVLAPGPRSAVWKADTDSSLVTCVNKDGVSV